MRKNNKGVITIREATEQDYDIIMAWWGIPEVRQYTTTKTQPRWDDLVKSIQAGNRKDYIILYQGRRIGRTCLIDHGDFEELSVYIGEISLHGRGLGKQVVHETIKKASKKIYCHVHRDNMASLKVFKKCGFQTIKEDNERIWLEFKSVK